MSVSAMHSRIVRPPKFELAAGRRARGRAARCPRVGVLVIGWPLVAVLGVRLVDLVAGQAGRPSWLGRRGMVCAWRGQAGRSWGRSGSFDSWSGPVPKRSG
jgi:hypothetical protein